MTESRPKDIWDKLQVAGALALPIVVLVVGNWHASALRESENRVKHLEIAVSVLQSKPDEHTRALRTWAIDVLSDKPVIQLRPEVKAELQKQRLPPLISGAISGNAVGEEPHASGGFAGK